MHPWRWESLLCPSCHLKLTGLLRLWPQALSRPRVGPHRTSQALGAWVPAEWLPRGPCLLLWLWAG